MQETFPNDKTEGIESKILNERTLSLDENKEEDDTTTYNLAKQEYILRECTINRNIFRGMKSEKKKEIVSTYYCSVHDQYMCGYCKDSCHKTCITTKRDDVHKVCQCGENYHIVINKHGNKGHQIDKFECPFKYSGDVKYLIPYYRNFIYKNEDDQSSYRCYYCYHFCLKETDKSKYKIDKDELKEKECCNCGENHMGKIKDIVMGKGDKKAESSQKALRGSLPQYDENNQNEKKKSYPYSIIGLKDMIEKYVDLKGQFDIINSAFSSENNKNLFSRLLNFLSIMENITVQSDPENENREEEDSKDSNKYTFLAQTEQIPFFDKIFNNLIYFELYEHSFIRKSFNSNTIEYLLTHYSTDDENISNQILLFYLKFHRKSYLKNQFYPFLDSQINLSPLHRLFFSKPENILNKISKDEISEFESSRNMLGEIIEKIETFIKKDKKNLYRFLTEYLKHIDLFIKFNFTARSQVEENDQKPKPHENFSKTVKICLDKLESLIKSDYIKSLQKTDERKKINNKIQKICENIYRYRNDYYFLNEICQLDNPKNFNINLFFTKIESDKSNINEQILRIIFNKYKFNSDESPEQSDKLSREEIRFKEKSRYLLDNLINSNDYYITSLEQIKKYKFLPQLLSLGIDNIIFGKQNNDYDEQKYNDDTLITARDLKTLVMPINKLRSAETEINNLFNLKLLAENNSFKQIEKPPEKNIYSIRPKEKKDEYSIYMVIKYNLLNFINYLKAFSLLVKARRDRYIYLKKTFNEECKETAIEKLKKVANRAYFLVGKKTQLRDIVFGKLTDLIESFMPTKQKIYEYIIGIIDDNPFIASIFFTDKMYKLILDQIIYDYKNIGKYDYDIQFYIDLMHILKNSNYKINTFTLVEHIYEIYQQEIIDILEENPSDKTSYINLQIKILKFFKLLLSVTHPKEYDLVNQKIAKIILPFASILETKNSKEIGINSILDCLVQQIDVLPIYIYFLNAYLSLVNKLEFNTFSLIKDQIDIESIYTLTVIVFDPNEKNKSDNRDKKLLDLFNNKYSVMKDLNLRKNFILYYIRTVFGSIYWYDPYHFSSKERKINKEKKIDKRAISQKDFKILTNNLKKFKLLLSVYENSRSEESTVRAVFSFLKNIVGYCSYLIFWKLGYYYSLSMQETYYIYKIVYLFMVCGVELFGNFIGNIPENLRNKYIMKYFNIPENVKDLGKYTDEVLEKVFYDGFEAMKAIKKIKTNFSNGNGNDDENKSKSNNKSKGAKIEVDSDELLNLYLKGIRHFKFYDELINHSDNPFENENEENKSEEEGEEAKNEEEKAEENNGGVQEVALDNDSEENIELQEIKNIDNIEGNEKYAKFEKFIKSYHHLKNSFIGEEEDDEEEEEGEKDEKVEQEEEIKKQKTEDVKNEKSELEKNNTNISAAPDAGNNAGENITNKRPDEQQSLLGSIFETVDPYDKDTIISRYIYLEILRAIKIEQYEDFEFYNPFQKYLREMETLIPKKGNSINFLTEKITPLRKLYIMDYFNSDFLISLKNIASLGPRYYQELILDEYKFSAKIIDSIISYQVYLMSQLFIFNSQSIIKTTDYLFNLLVNVFELIRLLCEDHNPCFQTFLIRPRYNENKRASVLKTETLKKTSQTSIFSVSFHMSIAIAKVFVHNKAQRKIIRILGNNEQFQQLIKLENTLSDFRTELIQGTTKENLDFLVEKTKFPFFHEYREYYVNYIFEEIDEDSDDIAELSSQFIKFIASYVEEICVYPLEKKSEDEKKQEKDENKGEIPALQKCSEFFNTKRLLVIAGKCLKILFIKNYVEDEEVGSQRMDFDSINEDEQKNIMTKFEKIIENLYKYYDNYTQSPYFNVSFFVYLLINQFADSNLEKAGTFRLILKEMSEVETFPRSGAALNITMFYYKFCSKLMMKNDIMYTIDYSKWNQEEYIAKYYNMILTSGDESNQESTEFQKNINNEIKEKHNASVNRVTIHYQRFRDSLLIKEEDAKIFKESPDVDYSDYFKKLSGLIEYRIVLDKKVQLRKQYSDSKSNLKLFLSELKYENWVKLNIFLCFIPNILLIFSSPGNIIQKIITFWELFTCIWLALMIYNYLFFQNEKHLNDLIKEEALEIKGLTVSEYLEHIKDPEIFAFTWTLGFGLLGMIFPFFYSFQLLILINISDTMGTVLKAIQNRYKQFLSTAVMLIILILFYAAVNNYFFQVGSDGSPICTTYLECFLLLFNSGTRAGGLEAFGKKLSNETGYISEFIYSWSFFFLISLIILNIINGIIVDAFQSLREEDNETYENKINVCFICQFKRSKFETRGINFENHCEHDHSVLNYFCYLFKIYGLDEHDLNSVDYQVRQSIDNHNISFFPIRRAKGIQE